MELFLNFSNLTLINALSAGKAMTLPVMIHEICAGYAMMKQFSVISSETVISNFKF